MILNYDTSFPVAIVVVLAFVVYKMYPSCNCLSTPYACISLFLQGYSITFCIFFLVCATTANRTGAGSFLLSQDRQASATLMPIISSTIFPFLVALLVRSLSLEPFMHPYIRATSFFSSWRTCFQFFQRFKRKSCCVY